LEWNDFGFWALFRMRKGGSFELPPSESLYVPVATGSDNLYAAGPGKLT
jgi:hypothetical protein